MSSTLFLVSGGLLAALRADVAESPYLVGFALVVLALTALICTVFVLRALISSVMAIRWRVKARRMRKSRKPGFLVLAAPFSGKGARRARAFATQALKVHLPGFTFNAPFEVNHADIAPHGRNAAEIARRQLVQTGADLIIWGQEVGHGAGPELRLVGLVRDPGGTAATARKFMISVPGDLRRDGEQMARLVAYGLCRELQPSLSRPQDFRADRLEPLTQRFKLVLEGADGMADAPILARLQDDFAAAALHLGEAKRDPDWLESARETYEVIVARGRKGSNDRWVRAKLGLGLAMVAQSEILFDPVKVQEGTNHIRAALDVLKSHDSLRAADRGIAALQRSERLLANRRRFSITWPT